MSSRLVWSVSQRCGEEEITRQMVLRDSMGRNTRDGLPGPGKSISIRCVEDTRNLQGWWCHLQKKNISGCSRALTAAYDIRALSLSHLPGVFLQGNLTTEIRSNRSLMDVYRLPLH